jgi:hypothetical protein
MKSTSAARPLRMPAKRKAGPLASARVPPTKNAARPFAMREGPEGFAIQCLPVAWYARMHADYSAHSYNPRTGAGYVFVRSLRKLEDHSSGGEVAVAEVPDCLRVVCMAWYDRLTDGKLGMVVCTPAVEAELIAAALAGDVSRAELAMRGLPHPDC